MSPSDLLWILFRSAFAWIFLGMALGGIFSWENSKISFCIKWGCIRSTLPIMIYMTVLINYQPHQLFELYPYAIAAVLFLALAYTGSCTLKKLLPIRLHGPSFHLGNSFHNYGFLAYGLVSNLIGEPAMPFLFVFVLVFEFLLWTWGVRLVNEKITSPFQAFFSPPAFALLMGIAYKTWMPNLIPDQVLIPLKNIGDCAVPLALTGLGGLILNICKNINWKTDFHSFDLWVMILYRHLIFPCIFIFLLLFTLPFGQLRSILLIQSIMPMALMPLNIVALYGGDKKGLGLSICVSMLICTITIPAWIICLKNVLIA